MESQSDPGRVADIALAAAIRSHADAVYVEPQVRGDDYILMIERGSNVIAAQPLDGALGSAVVARLAFIANLDLAAAHASSGVVKIKTNGEVTDVVITLRPGAALRCDLVVMPRPQQRSARPVTSSEPTTGDKLGNYRVVRRLGEGGMGTVFEVEHHVLGRHYALKVLRAKVVEREATAAQRFLREARSAARVHHPNIVDVFDFGHLADGRPYFVMELLEGESLSDRIERGPVPPQDVVQIARQLAGALAAVHERGVVHADVTPSNVLVVGETVKLVDFGLAELAGEAFADENSDFVLGTPAYISPEQLRGLAPTDRSDQYGLGAVLFELLSGHPPYQHPDLRQLCLMHVTAPIPVVDSPHGPLPPKLIDLVTTCLQKLPQQRFPGMRALLAALDEIEKVTDRRGWRRWLNG
jgi:serine/threonine protein kinase